MRSFKIEKNVSLFFDSLRGTSALVVLVVHIYKEFLLPKFGDNLVWDLLALAAAYAVMIFFIISGFMITSSILHNVEVNRGFSKSQFLKARMVRLYPPLLLALVLVAIVYAIVQLLNLNGHTSFHLPGDLTMSHEKVSLDWGHWFGSLVFLQNMLPSLKPPAINDPLWSLSFEFWYYMMAMFFTATWVNRQLLTGLIPLAGLLLYTYFSDIAHERFALYSSVWISGCILSLIYHKRLIRHPRFMLCSLGLIELLLIVVALLSASNPYGYLITHNQFTGSNVVLCLISIIVACLIAIGLRYLDSSGREWPLEKLATTASFSYTVYVIHVPLLVFAFAVLHPILHPLHWAYSAMVGVVSLFVITMLSARLAILFENPKRWVGPESIFQGVKRRFSSG